MEDDCVRRGIEAIERYAWHDDQEKRLQSCISPVWDTVLMTRALCDAGVDKNHHRIRGAIKWIKSKQVLCAKGDWSVFSRCPEPGGFSFEHNKKWGAFDIDNDKHWLNKIPFSDMDALCDPSSADITGRILEAFGLMMKIAETEYVEPQILKRISLACTQAIGYLVDQQDKSGAWYGKWGCNYLYGTSNAVTNRCTREWLQLARVEAHGNRISELFLHRV